MTIGIIVAMSCEEELCSGLLSAPHSDEYAGYHFANGTLAGTKNTAVIVRGGIGKACAAACTTLLLERYHPDYILSTGVAGAARTDIARGDIVVATRVQYHDVYCGPGNSVGQVQDFPLSFPCDERLVSLLRGQPTLHFGTICTGDWFVDTAEKARAILAICPAAYAVDMESAAIAQVCFMRGVPFLSLRGISDNPLLPAQAAQYSSFWETLAQHTFATLRPLFSLL